MYIERAEIRNIKAIDFFEINFQKQPGWHVLIGDNGAGKSSIIRSIALALVGPEEVTGIRPNWNDWLQKGETQASVKLNIIRHADFDVQTGTANNFQVMLALNSNDASPAYLDLEASSKSRAENSIWENRGGWFSAGFGPFRRLTGGSRDNELILESPSLTKLSSHLSLFGEDVALTEATKWMMKLQYQHLEQKKEGNIIHDLKMLINSPDFLPHNTQLHEISSDGVFFKDGNDAIVTVSQMSDGFRSILSLTFELIRLMVRGYSEEIIFKNIRSGNMIIDIPGVVLIDEIDAHLHPTWQTRIGQWFTKYFPNIQFIVTTHSPLICRACENGSIWRLATPINSGQTGEITGVHKEKLIHGNVLDAFGTEIFGKAAVRSAKSNQILEELGKLNMLSALGKISDDEEKTRINLQQILSTDDPVGFQ